MNFKQFILTAFLGVAGLVLLLILVHLSSEPDEDLEYVFKGDIVGDFQAEELVHAFRFDPSTANLYKGKGVKVVGQVLQIDASQPVRLGKLGSDEGIVACYFPQKTYPDIRARYKMGDMMTVVGECRGVDKRARMFSVAMKGCEALEMSMPPHQVRHP